MSNPFGDLSEGNHDQIRKYLRFFRNKKDGILRAINREFSDIKADRLNEDMYSKEDVHEFADFLASAIRTQVSSDIGTIINMGALAINQLLENSQDKGVELTLETSALENSVLLEQVDKMSLDSLPKVAKRGVGNLTSFKDEAKAIKEEQARLEDTNNRLQAEVNLLRHKLQMAERHEAEGKRQEDANDRATLRRLEQALEEAKEENSKRVSETSQFQQMRKLMQSQSTKIRDLRRRLEKYEPSQDEEEEDD